MKRKKGFIRSWLFIGLIIIVVFSLSGIGLAVAYKNGKFAQAQNPNPSTPPTSVVTAANRLITKTVPTEIHPGDNFDITLEIPGMKDASSQVIPADVMFVIDSSQSMDRPASPNRCPRLHTNNDDEHGGAIQGGQRMCYSRRTAMKFMDRVAELHLPIRVGYQLFNRYDKTLLSNADPDSGFYRFMGLTDLSVPGALDDLKAKIVGPCTGQYCQMPKWGSAMGLGIEKAERELENFGNTGSQKYIILISDGAENDYPPATSGCNLSNWPAGWPPIFSGPGGCEWKRYDYMQCDRLYNHTHPADLNLNLDMLVNPYPNWPDYKSKISEYCRQQGREPCVFSCNEVASGQGNGQSPFYEAFIYSIWKPSYDRSPADEAQKNNISVFSVGFYGGGSNTDKPYMERIGQHLYFPDHVQPWNPIADPNGTTIQGYYAAESDANYLYEIMDNIIATIQNRASGAQFKMVETLPLNAHVNIGDVSISNGVNLGLTPILDHDAQGRQTITLDTSTIPNFGYSTQTDPDTQTFQVRIQHILYQCAGDFDADQNYEPNGAPLDPMPSNVTWTFVNNGHEPIIRPMPRGSISCSTQYSGDIYGTNISNYAFPGIDVSVAKGTNSNTTAVWSLSDYDFSTSSFSNYNKFKNHVDKVTADLEKRAENYGPTTISNPNPHPGVNPQGGVWKTNDTLTISGQHTIGQRSNQRATIIVNGDLNFDNQADISKPSSSSNNNLLFIVKGNVNIGPDVIQLENIGIIATGGTINVGDSEMRIKGLLAANKIVLQGGTTSGSQKIHYDTSLALYPPPGLSSFDLPIFKEVKP